MIIKQLNTVHYVKQQTFDIECGVWKKSLEQLSIHYPLISNRQNRVDFLKNGGIVLIFVNYFKKSSYSLFLLGWCAPQSWGNPPHPALETGYVMKDMIIALGTRKMVTNP